MRAGDKKKSHSELLSELSSLESGAMRQNFLSRHKALLRSEFVKQLADLVVEKIRVNTAEAMRVAEAALLIAQKLRRKEDLALALRAKANALYACGENRAAIAHHERAFRLFEELGERLQAARTQSSSIQPLILLGEYERAFKAADQARETFKDLGQTLRIASLENNVGNIFHRQDRFEEALAHYERAYQVLSEQGQWERVAINLHNMAMCLISLNDFPRSLDCYQKARNLSERYGMPLLRDQADYNIAYLYYLRGEYSRAIEMLYATRRACEVSGDASATWTCRRSISS
jgi:tetratricopeptide (TPR) repeat protein